MSRRNIEITAVFLIAAAGLYAAWPRMTADTAAEAARIVELLELAEGDAVADIGAGDGVMTVPLARAVGPSGDVFASELDAEKRLTLRQAISDAGLENVAIVEALPHATNLPDACCDALLLRKVFHHVADPAGLTADMRRALRPGGKVAVIDFRPRWFMPKPETAPEERAGHGVDPAVVEEEMRRSGFQLVQRFNRWPERTFCLIFERAQG